MLGSVAHELTSIKYNRRNTWYAIIMLIPAPPRLPPALARLLAPLPLAPLALFGNRLLSGIARRHPEMFDRLGNSAKKSFLIDAIDLPFVFVMRPDPAWPRLAVLRRGQAPATDARIAAPLAVLLGLVQGTFDGDAQFFSRALSVEGDVEAVVALRNAIDDAELDLVAEAAAMLGPFSGRAEALSRATIQSVDWIARAFPPRASARVAGRLAGKDAA